MPDQIQPQQPVNPTPAPVTPQQPTGADAYLTTKAIPDDISETWRRTKCLVCGFVYEGNKTLEKCPKCGNTDKDKFQEAD